MKVALVTGCSAGIGLETTRSLAESDEYSLVVCAVRNPAKMVRAMTDVGFSSNALKKCEVCELNLSSLNSVDSFVMNLHDMKITNVHRLILNAGINDYTHQTKRLTEDGIDEIWQVNFFANFYLICLLMPILKATAGSRVVCLSSVMHWVGRPEAISQLDAYGAAPPRAKWWSTYADTKLAMTVLSHELCRRQILDSVAVNPGSVASDIFRAWYAIPVIGGLIRFIFSLVLLSCRDGCRTTLFACNGVDLVRKTQSFEYLSPYGRSSSKLPALAFLSDLYSFGIQSDPKKFIGQYSLLVSDSMIGRLIWNKSIDVLSRTRTQKSNVFRHVNMLEHSQPVQYSGPSVEHNRPD